MMILAVSWWILVALSPDRGGRHVVAMGPYPSKALCEVAGAYAMPHERRFWDDKRKAEDARLLGIREREIADAPVGGTILRNGDRLYKRSQKPFDWSISSSIWIDGPSQTAITGCVSDAEARTK